MSVDPLAPDYPWYTPYQFAGNMPIRYIDLDGLEPAEPGDTEGRVERVTTESNSPSGKFNSSKTTAWFWHEGNTVVTERDENGYPSEYKEEGWYEEREYSDILRKGLDSRPGSKYKEHDIGWKIGLDVMEDPAFTDLYNHHIKDIQRINQIHSRTDGGIEIADPTFDVITAGIGLPIKFATGLKLFGGASIMAGSIRVSKSSMGIRVIGSKKGLLSSMTLYKIGLNQRLPFKVPTLIGPNTNMLSAAIGRNAIPIGGISLGAGFLLDDAEEADSKTDDDEK